MILRGISANIVLSSNALAGSRISSGSCDVHGGDEGYIPDKVPRSIENHS